ncbi:MAG: DNA-binding protein WhiA, partial [Pyramidobacter sp.]
YCILRLRNRKISQSVQELLESSGVTFSARDKDGVMEITIRDLQHIMRFCYFMGLSQTAQDLEARSLLRARRDLANKQANCDSANIRRSVETSRQYIAMIQYLMKFQGGLVPEKLMPLAEKRLEYPEATLAEIGALLRPQVSKSTVRYRLQKLQRIAEEAGFDPSRDERG